MQTRAEFKRTQPSTRFNRRFMDPLPAEFVDSSDAKDLLQIIRLVLRRGSLVVASIIAGMGLAALVAFYVLPSYTAKALLVVGTGQARDSANADDMSIDTQIAMLNSQALFESVLQSLWQEPRLRQAIPSLRVLERHLNVMQELKSRLIAVSFTAKSPQVAADVANRIATLYVDDFVGRINQRGDASRQNAIEIATLDKDLQRTKTELARAQKSNPPSAEVTTKLQNRIADLTQKIDFVKLRQTLADVRDADRKQMEALSPPIRIFALAEAPEFPSSLSPIFLLVPAFFASSIFGIALALLLGRLDRRFYKDTDLAAAFEAPCLGSVPDAHGFRAASNLIPSPGTSRAHAIESMIASVLLLPPERPKIILVTSSKSGEGKTNFAASFAVIASRLHRRVLLIDIDTSRKVPVRHLAGKPGLFDILAGQCSAAEAIRPAPDLKLDLLSIGDYREDPMVALSGDRLSAELDRLRPIYDCIVINGPPVLGVTEVRILAAEADQIMLAVRARASKQPDVEEALRILVSSIAVATHPAGIATVLTVGRMSAGHIVPKGRRAASRAGDMSARANKRDAAEQVVVPAGAHAAHGLKDAKVDGTCGRGVTEDTSANTRVTAT